MPIDPRRIYLQEFIRIYRLRRATYLGKSICISLASAGAKAKVQLSVDEQRDVDEFIASKIKIPRGTIVSTRAVDVYCEIG